MKDAASDLVIIDQDGHTFVSAEYVERIPTDPSDQSIKSRFANPTEDVSPSTCLIRIRQSKPFYSLPYLNRILSSPKNARPLRVNLAIQTDAGQGDQHIVLGLRDLHDNNVPLNGPRSAGNDALQAVIQQESTSPVVRQGRSVDRFSVDSPFTSLTLKSLEVSETRQEQQKPKKRHRHEGGMSQQTDPSAGEQQSSSQHQAGSRQSTEAQPLTTALSNTAWQFEVPVQSRPVVGLGTAPRDAVVSDGSPVQSQTAGSTSLWEQLRYVQMTDDDVLQAFLDGKLPRALSVLSEASDTIIPFGILPNGENCAIKPFKDAKRSSPTLGIPRHKHDIKSSWDRRLLTKIEKYCNKADKLRRLIRKNNPNRESLMNGGLTPIETLTVQIALSGMCHHSDHTLETCVYKAKRFLKNYDTLLKIQGSGGFDASARNLKTQADEILKMVTHLEAWERSGKALPGAVRLNRLVRRVLPLDDTPMSIEHPLPMYVLPLGRLCRVSDGTNGPLELDEAVVMDVTSPRKALWRFGFVNGSSMPSCYYFLEMIAADINDIRPNQGTASGNGAVVRRNGVQTSGDAIWFRSTTKQSPKEYPESRVAFEPGRPIFDCSGAEDFSEAIAQGWSPIGPEKTSKHENEDGESQGSQRKRRKGNHEANEHAIPFKVSDNGKIDPWAKHGKARPQQPSQTTTASSSSQGPQLPATGASSPQASHSQKRRSITAPSQQQQQQQPIEAKRRYDLRDRGALAQPQRKGPPPVRPTGPLWNDHPDSIRPTVGIKDWRGWDYAIRLEKWERGR